MSTVPQEVEGMQQWAFKAAASALEVIPRTLAQNCGANVVRVLTQLRVSWEEHLTDMSPGSGGDGILTTPPPRGRVMAFVDARS